jgi:hypothetical protein
MSPAVADRPLRQPPFILMRESRTFQGKERSLNGGMFIVGNAILEDDLIDARFACDLDGCRGACCCLEGGRGAPLADDEVTEIERAYPVVRDSLPAEHRAVLERVGLVDGGPGGFATTCINDRACAFVYFDDEIARCAFERATSTADCRGASRSRVTSSPSAWDGSSTTHCDTNRSRSACPDASAESATASA